MNKKLTIALDVGRAIKQLYLNIMQFSRTTEGISRTDGGERAGSKEASGVRHPESMGSNREAGVQRSSKDDFDADSDEHA